MQRLALFTAALVTAVGRMRGHVDAQAPAAPLRVGAARVDITPKKGAPMAGDYQFRPVEGVLDPLYAKAIVVEQDGALAALVVLDLSLTSRPTVSAARKLIQKQ